MTIIAILKSIYNLLILTEPFPDFDQLDSVILCKQRLVLL